MQLKTMTFYLHLSLWDRDSGLGSSVHATGKINIAVGEGVGWSWRGYKPTAFSSCSKDLSLKNLTLLKFISSDLLGQILEVPKSPSSCVALTSVLAAQLNISGLWICHCVKDTLHSRATCGSFTQFHADLSIPKGWDCDTVLGSQVI